METHPVDGSRKPESDAVQSDDEKVVDYNPNSKTDEPGIDEIDISDVNALRGYMERMGYYD